VKYMKKVWSVKCFCLGHDYETLLRTDRYLALCHISPVAGCLSICKRCGTILDDTNIPMFVVEKRLEKYWEEKNFKNCARPEPRLRKVRSL
jgi:hypothetical protein